LSLANRPIKVEAAEAHLQLPDKVKAGDDFKVHWEGPNHHRDLITIVPENADEGERGKVVYTKQGNPLTLKAPDQPGRYEVRYLTGQTRKTLASRRVMVE
jgi:Ca-activated chloride channel family protein